MRITSIVLGSLLVAVSAWAQPPVNSSAAAPSRLGELSSRLNSTDVVFVRTIDERELEGDFVDVSDDHLTLMVHERPLVIAAAEIGEVRRHAGRMVHKGMLIGFLGGAAVGTMVFLSSDHTWSAGGTAIAGTFVGGGAGLMWGTVIGAFVHDHPVVYQKSRVAVRWAPVLTPHRAGLATNIEF